MRYIVPSISLAFVVLTTTSAVSDDWQPLPRQAASPRDNPTTTAKDELGKKLFFDPRLSLTGTVSCNSCHNIMEGGDDGRPTSMGIHGRLGPRNAPTVWNSVFQASQFWDGRSASLEDQAKGPIIARPEMGMPNHDKAIERIAAIPGYRAEFGKVFDGEAPITIDNAVKAIAAFERTLITPNSPYDRFVRGDKSAMNNEQVRGMKLFDSIGCTECHSGPAFNGWEVGSTTPSFEAFPRNADSRFVKQYNFDKDRGRFEVTGREVDRCQFKVPTLRNITITSPYFHNGAVSSLSEAIRVMAETQLDIKLSEADVKSIGAFLAALEGEFPQISLPRLPSRSGESVLGDQAPEAFRATKETTPQHGPPFGPGGRHRNDPRFAEDHGVFFFLLENRKAITRKVAKLDNGVETVTESNDPKVAKKIREHVAAMYDRVERVNPIHMRDPLFREVFRHATKIKMEMEDTGKGVRVTETSEDPYVAEMIKAHADVVSGFLKNGREELHRNHAVPKRPARQVEKPTGN